MCVTTEDGDSVRRMAEELKVGYIGMKENVHAKAGNYNHALARTTSPLVATFDADMIPWRQFLMGTVPYFQIPQVRMGLVQTPQSFYNQDLFSLISMRKKGSPMSRISSPGRSIFLEMQPIRLPTRGATR